jgi:Helix-turn-helix
MTMAEVAEQSGLTKGFVSKLERDLANVSVASLIRLYDALGISVGSLFTESRGEVVRAGAYPPVNFGGAGGTGRRVHLPAQHRPHLLRGQCGLGDPCPVGVLTRPPGSRTPLLDRR